MSLLSVVQDVCAVVGVERPTSVISGLNANRTMQEMLALATEMAQRIAYDAGHDWTMFRVVSTGIVGDGVVNSSTGLMEGTSAWPLPTNYKRMLLNSNVRSSVSPSSHMKFISDYDEWIERRLNNETDGNGEWIIAGGFIEFAPIPAAGVQIKFPYLDKMCIDAGGDTTDVFLNDTDKFRLDERLLKLGMIWQWKAQKGSPYAEDMGSFSDALAMAMGKDKPSPIIVGGRPLHGYNVVVDPGGWVWPLGGSVGPSP